MSDTEVRHRGGRVEIRGRVHGIMERQEDKEKICHFRVDAYDKDGRRMSYPVELRGRRFAGLLNEGDLVHFSAKGRPGETLRIKKLRNLTARGTFQVRGSSMRERAMLVAGIPGFIIYVVLEIAFFVAFMWALISLVGLMFE